MAIIYTYPQGKPKDDDVIVASRESEDEYGNKKTVTYSLRDLTAFIARDIPNVSYVDLVNDQTIEGEKTFKEKLSIGNFYTTEITNTSITVSNPTNFASLDEKGLYIRHSTIEPIYIGRFDGGNPESPLEYSRLRFNYDGAGHTVTVPNATGTLALEADVPTDYVDLVNDQVIEGEKEFKDGVILKGLDVSGTLTETAFTTAGDYELFEVDWEDGLYFFANKHLVISKIDGEAGFGGRVSAPAFKKHFATSDDILLGDGTTTSLDDLVQKNNIVVMNAAGPLVITYYDYVFVDYVTGIATINLPTAVGNPGKEVNITKRNSAFNTNVWAVQGEYINGQGMQTITGLYTNMTVVSDGSNWFIK